jgi:hypothetical protein
MAELGIVCPDPAERIFWVYSRAAPNHGKLYFGDDKVSLPAPSDDVPFHYGIVILKVERGEILREDGHAVVAVGRGPSTGVVPAGVTLPRLVSVFEKNRPKAFTQNASIEAKSLKNPAPGATWTESHIVKTGVVVQVRCTGKGVVWDTRAPYAEQSLELANDAIRFNNNTNLVKSNPALAERVRTGMKASHEVSLCGLARVSQMQLSWHSMPTPGTYGVTEALPIKISPALWQRVVDLAAMLCGFDEAAFVKRLGDILPAGDAFIGPHLVDRIHDNVLLNVLEGVAGIAVSALSFTAQWKDELYDNITSMTGKLGTEQDCEDQASATVAIITGVMANVDVLSAGPGTNALSQTLAYLIGTKVVSSALVLGLVDINIAKAKGQDHTQPTTGLAGHGWCSMTFADSYRPDRLQRTFFVESTCPYLIHPVDADADYEIAFQDLYGSMLNMYTNKALIDLSTYKTPQLQPSHRYEYVAFTCDSFGSYYVGPEQACSPPFVVGVKAHEYTSGKHALLDAAAHNPEGMKMYDELFRPFVFHPDPDPASNESLHRVLTGVSDTSPDGFLARNGGYKLSEAALADLKSRLNGIIPVGMPTESIVIVSAHDWAVKGDLIVRGLGGAAKEGVVYSVVSLPLADLLVLGIIHRADAQPDEDDPAALFVPVLGTTTAKRV